MKNKYLLFLLLFVLALASGISLALMRGGIYTITFSVISSGGRPQQKIGGAYKLSDNVAQPAGIAKLSGGPYTISGGYYGGVRPARLPRTDLDEAHAYPVPFKPFEGHKTIKFTKLTNRATIRIYTISGELVKTIEKPADNTDEIAWDVKNENNEDVFSGTYIYIITAEGVKPKKGKLIIIR